MIFIDNIELKVYANQQRAVSEIFLNYAFYFRFCFLCELLMSFTNLDKDFNSHFMTAKNGRPCQNERYFYILILQGDLAIIRVLLYFVIHICARHYHAAEWCHVIEKKMINF